MEKSGKSRLVLGQASGEDVEILREVTDMLATIVDHARADKRVSTLLEKRAMVQTINATIVLGETLEVKSLSSLLKTYKPIPLEYVRLVLSRLTPPDDNIVQRIYSEHKDDFEANMMALAVEIELNGNATVAFAQAMKLDPQTLSEPERLHWCGLLFQISQQIDIPAMTDAHADV